MYSSAATCTQVNSFNCDLQSRTKITLRIWWSVRITLMPMPPLPPPLLLAPPAGDVCACVVNNNNDSRNRNGTLYTRAAVGGRYVQVQQLLLYTPNLKQCVSCIYVHVYSSITQAQVHVSHFSYSWPLRLKTDARIWAPRRRISSSLQPITNFYPFCRKIKKKWLPKLALPDFVVSLQQAT